MPWLLNILYATLLLALSPVLIYRRATQGKYRRGWREKLLGEVPQLAAGVPRVWFHAVSVGEVLLLRGPIAELRRLRPDVDVVLTTTTETGYDVARQQFPNLPVCFFPLDFTWAVRRALGRLQPTLLVLAELELWPNLIRQAARQNVRLAIVNGRLSARSFRGYRRLKPLFARLLGRFDLIAVQNDDYAARFLALGAPAHRTIVTGSVKFDGVCTNRMNPHTVALGQAFGLTPSELVFIAGSTQAPEEEYALQTWATLRSHFLTLRLILVPRHRERFEEVAALVRQSGYALRRRTEIANAAGKELGGDAGEIPAGNGPVLLLDTLGELGACWGLADVAFVGGSLTNRGGQNMIEPAAYGAAVLFGPNTRNFRDIVQLLLDADAAVVVGNGAGLTTTVGQLLGDAALRQELGARAAATVAAHCGATARTVELINDLLSAETAATRVAA